MNKVSLLGRLTAKPELRYTSSNTAFLRFTIAVNRNFTGADGKREADFINVVAWRKQAETISKYFDKGNLIAIEGRLQTGSYKDNEGNKHYTMDVALENFNFVESKDSKKDSTKNNTGSQKQYNDPFSEYGEQIVEEIPDDFFD